MNMTARLAFVVIGLGTSLVLVLMSADYENGRPTVGSWPLLAAGVGVFALMGVIALVMKATGDDYASRMRGGRR